MILFPLRSSEPDARLMLVPENSSASVNVPFAISISISSIKLPPVNNSAVPEESILRFCNWMIVVGAKYADEYIVTIAGIPGANVTSVPAVRISNLFMAGFAISNVRVFPLSPEF
ncbi:MAG: hypothetical protein BWY67_01846 [Bacteroidetes bacterium ADurb.Bin397]|nr:MAG: hypothetical protein BWY67_01846 [Bacteroidetes bacterium ADurb.Bin397]